VLPVEAVSHLTGHENSGSTVEPACSTPMSICKPKRPVVCGITVMPEVVAEHGVD